VRLFTNCNSFLAGVLKFKLCRKPDDSQGRLTKGTVNIEIDLPEEHKKTFISIGAKKPSKVHVYGNYLI